MLRKGKTTEGFRFHRLAERLVRLNPMHPSGHQQHPIRQWEWDPEQEPQESQVGKLAGFDFFLALLFQSRTPGAVR